MTISTHDRQRTAHACSATFALACEDQQGRPCGHGLGLAGELDAAAGVGAWLAGAVRHTPRITGFTSGGRIVGDPLGPAAHAVFGGARIPLPRAVVMPWAEVAALSSDIYTFTDEPILKASDGPTELRFRLGVRARIALDDGLELDPEAAVEDVERAGDAIGARRIDAGGPRGRRVAAAGEICNIAIPMIELAGKRIVVTGGAGFLGSFVVDALRARGVRDVIVPRRRDYDLVDRTACARLVRDHRPDLVFHLAARVGGIGANRDNPGLFLFDNAMMGLQLIEECRLGGVAKVVIAGTICAYPKHAPVPFREADLWNGYPEETNAPYGMAKRLLLVQAQAYRAQYGLDAIVLFPVNLYGPRDNFDLETSHVIPAMIRKCLIARQRGDREIVLWGDGTPTREFLYVEDAAEAFVLAAERYDGDDPVNVGTGEEIAIRDLAHQIAAATGFTGELVWDAGKPNGQPRRRLDVTRAHERFGFTAKTSFAEGLRRTVAWAQDALARGAL